MSVSRRGLFGAFFKPLKAGGEKVKTLGGKLLSSESGASSSEPPRPDRPIAVIQGRHCLAYQEEHCTVCYERCPVPGAIQLDDGLPRVVLSECTGCGVCHDVCPAPQNAIMITERRPGVGL